MLIETVVVGAFQCNCTIIACDKTKEAIVIDPGDEPEKILEVISHYDLKVKYLLHTHAHLDHIMGTRGVKEKAQGEILLHKDDLFIYNTLKNQAAMFGMHAQDPLKPDRFLEDGEIVSIGEQIKAQVVHTPGHSPGSI
ncbi:MAG: MBL fold metallo-hydrolase, partial [Candidatus Sericytochromatia bacterium]